MELGKERYMDGHLHTTASDGVLTVEEIIAIYEELLFIRRYFLWQIDRYMQWVWKEIYVRFSVCNLHGIRDWRRFRD